MDLVLAEGPRWSFSYFQSSTRQENEVNACTEPLTLRVGKTYAQTLNTAVHGPALASNQVALTRSGDEIRVCLLLVGDGRNSAGEVSPTSARTVLTRDGKLLAENTFPGFGRFTGPEGDGAYRLETSLTQKVSELSTSVSAAWTFRSSHVDGVKQLPLSVIRFRPSLTATDLARVGLLHVLIVVQSHDGTPRVRKIEVESSSDDGKTWRHVPTYGNTAFVRNDRPGSPPCVPSRSTPRGTPPRCP